MICGPDARNCLTEVMGRKVFISRERFQGFSRYVTKIVYGKSLLFLYKKMQICK